MNGLGISALLVARLRGRERVPGIDEDIARRDAAVLRFALMLGVQLALFLGLTLAVGLRHWSSGSHEPRDGLGRSGNTAMGTNSAPAHYPLMPRPSA